MPRSRRQTLAERRIAAHAAGIHAAAAAKRASQGRAARSAPQPSPGYDQMIREAGLSSVTPTQLMEALRLVAVLLVHPDAYAAAHRLALWAPCVECVLRCGAGQCPSFGGVPQMIQKK